MVPSLRGRLVCFYCSSKSAQTRRSNLVRWQCEKCEAVNHLDENGEITDPPSEEASSNARYAQSIQRPTSPVFDVPDESLFCKTCIKNQLIFSESLASYFPSQDAPNYADYEKQYPKFRKDLEERYPQVCGECEPRVRERIRATGYAAKTDHLRRLMERSRGGYVPRNESGWKGLLVFLCGVAWFLSIIGQLAWDGTSLLLSKPEYGELIDEDAAVSSSDCLNQLIRGVAISPGCSFLIGPVAPIALFLGVMSLWWNPRFQERLRKPGGRIVGMTEYYKLQAILLFARCLTWIYINGLPSQELDSQTTKGIHAGLLVFTILLTVMSFRAISIDYTPRVVFENNSEPLMPQRSNSPTTTIRQQRTENIMYQPSPYSAQRNPNIRPFSINDLAPTSTQQRPAPYQSPYQPPTPPPDEDEDGAMDWIPSQQTAFKPATVYRPRPPALNQPTPFRGHLPADVVSMEHRLRNPPNKPTFRKASEESKQNFFRVPKKNAYQDYDNASDSATEYEPSIAATATPASMKFADPKLRLQPGPDADTGLERLLANAFTLEDEPQEVRAVKQRGVEAASRAEADKGNLLTHWHRLPVWVLLVSSCFLWTSAPKSSLEAQSQLGALLVAGLASLRSLVLVLCKTSLNRNASDLVLFTAELMGSIILALVIRQPSTDSFLSANKESIHSIGTSLLCFLVVQEIWLFAHELQGPWRSDRTSGSSPSTPVPPADSSSSPQVPSLQKEKASTSTIAPSSRAQPPSVPISRSTRSKTKEKKAPAGSGFSSLSLGRNESSEPLGGMSSLSLGQSRRNNRNGMW